MKAGIGLKTRKLYSENNRAALKELADKDYKKLKKLYVNLYYKLENRWMKENKPNGFEVMNIRIGGMISRIEYCRKKVRMYAMGKINKIEELDEPLIDVKGGGENFGKKPVYLNRYYLDASVNIIS